MVLRRNIPHLNVDLCWDGTAVLVYQDNDYHQVDRAFDLYSANEAFTGYVIDKEYHEICDAMNLAKGE